MFSKKRQKVIEYSVKIEQIVSAILARLLDIDYSESKALGNSSSSLSFQNKLILLKDIKTIDNKDKIKFDYFSAIRNQFAHNANVVDFTSCFEALGDMDAKLKKLYKGEIDESCYDESQREKIFNKLYDDLNSLTKKLLNAIYDKALKAGRLDGANIMRETLLETIDDFISHSKDNKKLLNEILKVTSEKYKRKTKTMKNNSH
ncbi:MAG: hypothetical protein JWQ09_261 [Segetibacter sp.]|nr:hypothetical protein [Segetibacter sp.]